MRTYALFVAGLGLMTASALVLASCNKTQNDSGKIGTFDVVATQADNTCGPQWSSNQQGRYAVDLLVQTDLFTWRPIGGDEGTGVYDPATGAFRVQTQSSQVVRESDARTGVVGCTINRVELVQGTIDLGRGDAGVAPDAVQDVGVSPEVVHMNFDATHTVYFAASAGSDCARLVGVEAGQLLAIPCSYSSRLQGVAR